MKQYFLKGVDEPLEYGDTIGFDLAKTDDKGQSVTKHVECKFIPEIIPLLLEEEVIEEKKVKDKPKTIDFSGDDNSEENAGQDAEEVELQDVINTFYKFMDATTDALEDINKRLSSLERKNAPYGSGMKVFKTISIL